MNKSRPWYKQLSVQFLMSIAAFIILVEAGLMVLSYFGMESRLLSLRQQFMQAVPEGVQLDSVLDEQHRDALLTNYLRNIGLMVLLILTVVLSGVGIIFNYWVKQPLTRIVSANNTSVDEGHPELLPENKMPENEIGDIMRSRNDMLKSIQELFNEEAIDTLVQAVDAKDSYTHGHSNRVAKLGQDLSRELDLQPTKRRLIHRAGRLHDIGKISVNPDILTKPDGLTDREYDHIKEHPVDGANMIRISNFDDMVLDGIRYHHERWDGTGYPDGLEAEEIPLAGRILAVADAIDAMISDRHYRDALPLDDVYREIETNLGSQFCPDIGQTALDLIDDGWLEHYHQRQCVLHHDIEHE